MEITEENIPFAFGPGYVFNPAVFGDNGQKKRSFTLKKCNKLLANGDVCGKKPGTCMHNWIPTKFGEQ